MIRSLLVANRGEIARRIFRTCRELGIATVAVHSDADATAPHVHEADAAVRLPGDAPADTYLRGDLIVKAALAAGADAVHPGYGFLSERADFARAVADAGLVWVGPPPAAMEAMASKTRAKQLMHEAGVPLLAPADPDRVTAADLPLLVKAAAGGGGRGMRVVRDLDALAAELDSARAEAASAFGDGEVFLEPYMEGARHVEVQILADTHGTVWTLGTRDCSLQRRHQKVIEEAPAPGLSDALRTVLHESAANAARSIGYEGAGTVEFLVSGERAYFLEMNTRLQVEHPVTEEVYGLDLVALQLRVAEGERLGEAPPEARGHAVEARLYAEDPGRGWQPQTGAMHRFGLVGGAPGFGGGSGSGASGAAPWTVYFWRRPSEKSGEPQIGATNTRQRPGHHPCDPGPSRLDGGSPPGLRIDSGIVDGDEIGVHYDPMLAKVIAWAPTRAEALRRLAHELERACIHGPVTNREMLVRALRHPEFIAERMDTGFLERHLDELTEADDAAAPLAALVAAVADAADRPASIAGRLGGWRNVPSQPQIKTYRGEPDGTEHEVRYRLTRDGLVADHFPDLRIVRADPHRVVLEVDGIRRTFDVAVYGDRVHVDSPLGSFAFTALPRFPDPTARTEPGSLLAPMPGTVVRVAEVAVGDRVEAGQPLLWLEAMKMEHRITAPAAGVLTALHVATGRQVEVGALLAVVAEDERT
ncbi:acetyl/propionyl/methylcrotonyl-CoA carboxylase subunit alpha [Streptomyces coffeae]|uniref:Acety-l/propionyl-CoA carboxylase subunit alpha n=1 Tax=Streptomyces coffeae TaxID=621382 RepID=A0ABS1N5N1_9ACTN|nr:biotin carboxylase N-terminal domain-containing protein [Streptomyces coffeae]MBL1095382.1 acety-l/propionyl-CoA carboxylase subunit alpha [Streptomyces coffeae]